MTEPLFPAEGNRRGNRSRQTQPRRRPPPGPPPPPPNRFQSAKEFFTEALSVWYARQLGAHRWCDHCWDHLEMKERVTALWLAYEKLNSEGGEGLARWWVMYADPMMTRLFDKEGAFALCDHETHKVLTRLPG